MDELNEPQLEAVAHVKGPLLVFAGAGSGKTRVITYRIANLVATHGIPPYRILAVTFTNKAAGEMRARLVELLSAEVARELWVGTFHATCARLIRKHHEALGLTRDFVIYDDADQRSVINRIVKEKKIDDRRYPPRQLLSAIHKQKQEGVLPSEVHPSTYFDDTMVQVFAAYEAQLRACNACDFDDLLLHVLRLVELPHGDEPAQRAGAAIRSQFRWVLVDEFQDTNAVQYRMLRAIVRDHHNLAVVGDDDQSIYRWRGADVRNIRGFSTDFPEAKVVRLEQNYRSSARIVRAALGVIAPSRQRVSKELWTANDDGARVEVRAANDERDEASQVVQLLQARQREGWTPSESAILYRTHAQSRVLEEALRAARIPYKIVGGLRFYDRAEVKDLLSYLRLVANPRSDVDVLRVINVPARGLGSTTVERVQKVAETERETLLDAVRSVANGELDAGVAAAARKKLAGFLQIVDDLADAAMRAMPPSEIAAMALERSGYRASLEAEDTDESATRLQNLGELVGSLRDYEQVARAEGVAPSVTGFLERTALLSTVDEGASSDVLTLTTVHAAKGLEFRGVMITGLENELFPFKGFRALDDALSLEGELSGEEEDLEEERRLAYVAITRARERLTLFYAERRTVFGQTRESAPSRFLRDLPQADLEHYAPTARGWQARRGWGGAPPSNVGPRAPFRHPMRGDDDDGYSDRPSRSRASDGPARAPGERYVELDEDAAPRVRGAIRRGGVVRHEKFGDGEVLEVIDGPEPRVVAAFPGRGRLTVLRRFLEWVG